MIKMTLLEFAKQIGLERKTVLAICHNPKQAPLYNCQKIKGRWHLTVPTNEKLYASDRVAEIMSRSRRHVERWCKNGTIQAYSAGRKYLIPKSEVTKIFTIRD